MFTLIMLVFMECIGVSQRINNMQRLRDMAGESTLVQVFRSNNWREINSSGLLPGDIVRVAPGLFSHLFFKNKTHTSSRITTAASPHHH